MKQTHWQVKYRLTCFGGREDVGEGPGARGSKTLDAELRVGVVISGHWGAMEDCRLGRNKAGFGPAEEP